MDKFYSVTWLFKCFWKILKPSNSSILDNKGPMSALTTEVLLLLGKDWHLECANAGRLGLHCLQSADHPTESLLSANWRDTPDDQHRINATLLVSCRWWIPPHCRAFSTYLSSLVLVICRHLHHHLHLQLIRVHSRWQQVTAGAVCDCLPCYRTEAWCYKLACKSPDTF